MQFTWFMLYLMISRNNFSKEGTLMHLKWYLSLLNFRVSFLHIWSTLHSCISYKQNQMAIVVHTSCVMGVSDMVCFLP